MLPKSPHANKTASILVLAGAVLATATIISPIAPNIANAEELWTFCLATNFDAHKVYFTNLVKSDGPYLGLESMLETALVRAGIAVNVVQCPLGQSRSQATVNLRRAKDFNAKIDNRILEIEIAP